MGRYRRELARALWQHRPNRRGALTSGVGESYTPSAIGAGGAVYAVNHAVLFSIGKWPLLPRSS